MARNVQNLSSFRAKELTTLSSDRMPLVSTSPPACVALRAKNATLWRIRDRQPLSYMNQIARYFTSGFVGLNTSVGLSFQVHACTIQLVSAVNRPPRSMHCDSVSRMKVAALCGVKTPD
jgi:hypothetical protein